MYCPVNLHMISIGTSYMYLLSDNLMIIFFDKEFRNVDFLFGIENS